MRFLIVVMVAFIVAACTSGMSGTQAWQDDWTGAHHLMTREYEVSRDADAIMTVHGIRISNANGQTLYGIMTNVRRSGPNGPRIQRVTVRQTQLPYRRFDRLRTLCLDGCALAELGLIPMTKAGFAIARQQGIPLRVWGKRRRYEGFVPPELFSELMAAEAAS